MTTLVAVCALTLASVNAVASENAPVEITASTVVADSINRHVLEKAVKNYNPVNEQTVVDLVNAVAAESTVDIGDAGHASIENGWMLSGKEGQPALGIRLAGTETSKMAAGVLVSPDVDKSITAVSRATGAGAQVLAVLEGAGDVHFDLALPQNARLLPLADGSISVTAPVEVEVPLAGEEARVETSAQKIIGDIQTDEEFDSLTDEQWEKLARIPDIQTKTENLSQEIAVINPAWAVDAKGAPLKTEYVLEGNTLIQRVHTDESTAFPVVADPSWTWWVKKGAACAAGVASMATFGYARVSVGIAKLVVKMKKAPSASKLGKAYAAWKKLGTSESARFKELGRQIKSLASLVVKHGSKGLGKHRAKGSKAAASISFIIEGGKAVGSLFGIYQCWEMVDAI
ncbi:hypothetical protein [Timonella sp. A28]|uniref:hypothetical protein n=1 Tax=Timonella sp. A28 TaxID=3442640 RepID=UPI003EBE8EAC